MALITNNKLRQKEQLKIELDVETLNQMKQYCEWAQFENISHFIEESAHFVFAKDKEFKAHQKLLRRRDKTKNETSTGG